MFSSDEKGKGRATSPAESDATPNADTVALAVHRSLLTSMLPSLTCQICLLLMSRPFALAPCGHVSCHACLVSWFSNEPGTLGQAAPPAADAPNANGPATNAADNAAPAAAAPAAPAVPPFVEPIVRKKKTCPQCRAVVRERPVEVWSIKDMVGAVVRSGLADPESVPIDLREDAASGGANDASAADPWNDIFPNRDAAMAPFAPFMARENVGILDEEDGGVYRCIDCTHEIWDGVCSHCNRVYPGHTIDFDSDSQDDEEMDPWWMHSDLDEDEEDDRDAYLFSGPIGADGLPLLIEPEDLIRLLGRNNRDDVDDMELDGRGDSEDEVMVGGLSAHTDDGEDTEEEGYESSFIDDDDVVEVYPDVERLRPHRSRHGPAVIDLDEDDEDEPVRRPSHARHPTTIVVSSGEEDEDEGGRDHRRIPTLSREEIARIGLRRIYTDTEDESDEEG